MRRLMLAVLIAIALTGCGQAAEQEPVAESTARPAAATEPSANVEPTAEPPAAPTEEPTVEAPTQPTEAPTEAAMPPAGDATEVPVETVPAKPTEPVALPTATALPPTAPPATATTAPPSGGAFNVNAISVALEPVVSGFRAPLAVVHAGDGSGRLFVVEKGGRVRIVQDGQLLPTPFLDVSGLVSSGSEQGLLGMAFEPGRPERFYINYTDRNGDTVIARYRVSPDRNVADPGTGEALLTIQQPAGNHNGGHLLFGPDGYLWIGMGDGGGAGDVYENGQNFTALLGSMLRLDVSGERGYTTPSDNPFDGAAGASAIWSKGLRNPWRYSFDRATGDLWLADVGQGEWEEINRVSSKQAGLNYGWPLLEGSHCYAQPNCQNTGLVAPVSEYDHSLGCTVVGGYVYRGQAFPALQGGYFFADYCSGILWALDARVQGLTEPRIVLNSGIQGVSSFGEDEAGEVYVTAFDGTLYRLVAR